MRYDNGEDRANSSLFSEVEEDGISIAYGQAFVYLIIRLRLQLIISTPLRSPLKMRLNLLFLSLSVQSVFGAIIPTKTFENGLLQKRATDDILMFDCSRLPGKQLHEHRQDNKPDVSQKSVQTCAMVGFIPRIPCSPGRIAPKLILTRLFEGSYCLTNGASLTFDVPPPATSTARRTAAGCMPNPNRCSTINGYASGYNCDEYPFASVEITGGATATRVNRCVPSGQNSSK